MKDLRLPLLLWISIVFIGCTGFQKGRTSCETAIKNFHVLFNQGKIDQIWEGADPQFQKATTREKFNALMKGVGEKLGKVTASTNVGWKVAKFNFETKGYMNQRTTFEKGTGAESFTFVVKGTNAVLLGYNIQSADLFRPGFELMTK